MKKILIFTVTAGEGHNSVASAIKEEMIQRGNEVKLVDVYKTHGTKLQQFYMNDGYRFVCNHLLTPLNAFYNYFYNADPNLSEKSVVQRSVKNVTSAIYGEILDYDPDVIICTHSYPAIAITNLRKNHTLRATVFFILTDYTVHPFCECARGVDYILTPCKEVERILLLKGYKPQQIICTGMPVKSKFSMVLDRTEIRTKLNLPQNRFLVMIMVGGGGFGHIFKLLKEVMRAATPLGIVVINGLDKKSKQKIDKYLSRVRTHHLVYNFGYVNNIDEFMSACDVLVGKCGGISSSESLNKVIPLITTSKLPMQEKKNMEYLLINGACIKVTRYLPLSAIIDDLATNSNKMQSLKSNIIKLRKLNALKNVCDFALEENIQKYIKNSKNED